MNLENLAKFFVHIGCDACMHSCLCVYMFISKFLQSRNHYIGNIEALNATLIEHGLRFYCVYCLTIINIEYVDPLSGIRATKHLTLRNSSRSVIISLSDAKGS